MSAEDRARELLQQAALTIDVGPAGPVRAPVRGGRWLVPAVAVAAAVAIAAVVTGLVLGARDRPVDPAPADPDALPSVLGLLRDDAVARLETAGFEVRVTTVPDCAPDGAALEVTEQQGGTATLLVNDLTGTALDCPTVVSDEAWAFVGMLNGGPEVPVTRPVQLRVDGGRPTYLDATEVADVDAWGGPGATALRSALGDPDAVLSSTPLDACTDPRLPATGADGPGVLLVRPADPCGTRLALRLDTDGVARRVGVTTSIPPAADEVPDLTGSTEAEARAALSSRVDPDQVFVVRLEAGCAQTLEVSQQDPRPGARLRPQDAVVLTIDSDTAGCGQPIRTGPVEQAAGAALVDLANGGRAPAFAERVRLFVGRAPVGTLTGAQAADLRSWQGCPDTPGYTCPVALLAGLSTDGPDPYDVAVRAEPVLNPCGGWLAAERLPSRITAYDSFFLSPPQDEITCATGFRLQVFLDGRGRIAAVDLARTEP